jgi:very-short-patch-repair endonuclease
LFDKIYFNIKNNFGDVYYATRGQLSHQYDNNEFSILTINNKFRFLDFYIPEINKCIEFDGDYWHGEKRGNQLKDELRETEIKNTIKGIKILHVKENEYRKDPEKVLNECLEFINDSTNRDNH